jgi:peptidoglycan hydrolase-like protein with peptidoglycan-binding domain
MSDRKRQFALSLILFASSLAFAQHQRLGLPPQAIHFEGTHSEATVEAFCLDLQLSASRDFVPYGEVLNENPAAFVLTADRGKLPLAAAIKEGLVSVEGVGDGSTNSGLAMKFIRHNNAVKQIVFESATAFGEKPGGLITAGSTLLKELSVSKPVPDKIWAAQAFERILSELALYPDAPVSPANTQTALRNFQASNGLPVTGSLDPPTSDRLTAASNALIARLAKVGFVPDRKQTKVISISDPLRQFQDYHNLPETGHISPEVMDRLAKDEAIATEVDAIARTKGPVSEILSGDKFSNVLTFYRSEAAVHALVQNGSQQDYWIIAGSKRSRGVLPGGFGRLQFLNEYHEFISKVGDANGIVTVSTDQVGDKELADLEQKKSLQGPDSIVVLVSPLQQGRPVSDRRVPSATRVARALRQHFGDDTSIYIGQDPTTAINNANHLPTFSGPQDLTFFVDGKRVDDRGIVQSLRDKLETLDIDVVEAQDAPVGEAHVGIVVGKNDANMRSVLTDLARQGAFKESILAIAKCGNSDDIVFNSSLIHESGARAVVFYDEKIQPQAVKRVLLALTKRLTDGGVPEGDWFTLWQLSVKDAASNASASEGAEILKLGQAHIQTSRVEWTPLSKVAEENL